MPVIHYQDMLMHLPLWFPCFYALRSVINTKNFDPDSDASFINSINGFVDVQGMIDTLQQTTPTNILEDGRIAQIYKRDADTSGEGLLDWKLLYPVEESNMKALLALYQRCRTSQNKALKTWCIGDQTRIFDDSEYNFPRSLNDSELFKYTAFQHTYSENDIICQRGIRTHPCTGRVITGPEYRNITDANIVLHQAEEFKKLKMLWPWEGIKCDANTSPVTITHISLPYEGLDCRLEDIDLSLIPTLQELNLQGNRISGSLPLYTRQMQRLKIINLDDNQLDGALPLEFGECGELETVKLRNNNLYSEEPSFFDAFGNMPRLRVLDLSSNAFKTSISAGLCSNEILQEMNISHNHFYGSIPECLGALHAFRRLSMLDISYNHFIGALPTTMSNWGREDIHNTNSSSSLEIIDVSNNKLSGSLPCITNLTNLESFAVHNNQFSGIFPQLPKAIRRRGVAKAVHEFQNNSFSCISNLRKSSLPFEAKILSIIGCNCGDGTANLNSNILDATHCTACKSGYFSNSLTNYTCTICPIGSNAAKDGSVCEPCRPGTFWTSGMSRNDWLDAKILLQDDKIHDTEVENLEYGTCEKCPPGSFSDFEGSLLCSKCIPGTFSQAKGAATCLPCPPGTQAPKSGATMCTPCESGTYASILGSVECTRCPEHTYQDLKGGFTCYSCPTGSVALGTGNTQCSKCPAGTYYDSEVDLCLLCPPNSYSKYASFYCAKCPNGTFAIGFGNVVCFPKKMMARTGHKNLPGRFRAHELSDSESFNGYTPPHTKSSEIFSKTRTATCCHPCPAGTYTLSKGASTCTSAPSGYFVADEGNGRPIRCSLGTYSTHPVARQCNTCIQGGSIASLLDKNNFHIAQEGEVYDRLIWPALSLHIFDFFNVDDHDHGIFHVDKDDTKFPTSSAEIVIAALRATLDSLGICEQVILHVRNWYRLCIAFSLPCIHAEILFEISGKEALKKKLGLLGFMKENDTQAYNRIVDEERRRDLWLLAREESLQNSNLLNTLASQEFGDLLRKQLILKNGPRSKPFDASGILARIDAVSIYKSIRVQKCKKGTHWAAGSKYCKRARKREERIANASDEHLLTKFCCLPCLAGTFSSTEGSLRCTPCPIDSYTDTQGSSSCKMCGYAETTISEGSSTCIACGFLSPRCDGFWLDLIITVISLGFLAYKIFEKSIRNFTRSDFAIKSCDKEYQKYIVSSLRLHQESMPTIWLMRTQAKLVADESDRKQ